MPSWLAFALASPALFGASTIIDKFLIDKRIKDPVFLTAFGGFIVLAGAAAIFAIRGFGTLPGGQIAALIAIGIMDEIALVPYYKALSYDDASSIMPFFQLVPVLVLTFSYFFLREALTAAQVAAFVLILSGSFLLAAEKIDAGMFRPRKSLPWVVLTSVLWAAPAVIFKSMTVDRGFWHAAAYTLLGIAAGAFILFAASYRRSIAQLGVLRADTWAAVGMNEVIYFLGQMFWFYAIALGPVSLVSVMGGLIPLFVFLYGTAISLWLPKILREDLSRGTVMLKIAALALVLGGVWFINR